MSDELRNRLGRIDPMGSGVPTEPMTTQSSRHLLEEIMSTSVSKQAPRERGVRRTWLVAATAVVALVVAVGGLTGLFAPSGDQVAAEPLVLSTGDSTIMASCLPVSVEYLAPMPVAFAGTATSVSGDEVILTVDHWYEGGEAAEVILRAPQGLEALIDGFAFEVGAQYLITATEGTVNYCGFSGKATPELRALYEQAFGG